MRESGTTTATRRRTTATAPPASRQVLNGIKDRLTSITRFPYNFIKGPFIGWDAPKAFISDMGGFTLPQVAIAAILGGSGETNVLGGNRPQHAHPGPAAACQIPQSDCVDAVKELIGRRPAARRRLRSAF